MSIRQRIVDDMKASMKSGDKDRLGTLRMLKAKIQQLEVDLRAEKGRDHELDDDESIRALSAYAKQVRPIPPALVERKAKEIAEAQAEAESEPESGDAGG